jgi:hypothetical protein
MSKKHLALTILVVGVAAGLVLGVGIGRLTQESGRRHFRGSLTVEQPADVAHPVTMDREDFTLQYPGNWRLNADAASNRSPDRLFSLDSPGSSFVMFARYDVLTDPVENLRIQMEKFVPAQMTDFTHEPLTRWGAYEGVGDVLKGRTPDGAAARLRIFSHSDPEQSFVAVEMVFDEDAVDVEPGVKLIEATFRLK